MSWSEIRNGSTWIAIDPGKTCGVATGDVYLDGGESKLALRIVSVWQETGPELVKRLERDRFDHVVCERFTLVPKAALKGGHAEETLKLVGVIAYLAGDAYTEVAPSNAKSTVTDERLKRWGWWVEGQPHARDAVRVAYTWARRRQ